MAIVTEIQHVQPLEHVRVHGEPKQVRRVWVHYPAPGDVTLEFADFTTMTREWGDEVEYPRF